MGRLAWLARYTTRDRRGKRCADVAKVFENGLFDELHIVVQPIIAGKADKLFEGRFDKVKLRLVDEQKLRRIDPAGIQKSRSDPKSLSALIARSGRFCFLKVGHDCVGIMGEANAVDAVG
jgi:hypothetical protein